MFIDEENPEKLKQLGLKIKAAKALKTEIIAFFVKDDKPVYGSVEETQFLIDVINLYIRGESSDYIGDVHQIECEDVRKLFDLLGLE